MSLFKWAKHRAKEHSTWVGLGTAAGGIAMAVGKPELFDGIAPLVPILGPVLSVLGGILIGKPKKQPEQGILPLRSGR